MRQSVICVLTGWCLIIAAVCARSHAGPVKNRRTLWSGAELTKLRNAPGEAPRSRYEDLEDEALWNLMVSTTHKRTHCVNWLKGCPVHGRIRRRYMWKLDPVNHPGQVQCPLGGEWYPNKDYPDDGDGYRAPDGSIHHFKRYYAFWVYEREIMAFKGCGGDNALEKLTTAYLKTRDRNYPHKAAILLTRIALEMPNSTTKRNRCLKGAYGHWAGLISDYVWEARNAGLLARYYEIIHDAIDDDAELVAFIKTKIPELDSGPKIREYIEDKLLRVVAQALIDETLDGNPGYPQYSGAILAAVLDDFDSGKHPNSADILEWLYYGWGQFRFMFSNFLLPDGGGFESLGYSKMMLDLVPTVDVIERYRALVPDKLPASRYPDLRRHPKVRKMLDFQIDTWDQGGLLPGIGDGGGNMRGVARDPVHRTDWHSRRLFAFTLGHRWYEDPRYARVLVQDDGTVLGQGPVLPLDAEALKKAAADAPDGHHRATMLLDNYGIAFLRGGPEEHPRTIWVYYGEGRVHHHVDPLNLGLFAWRRDLLPELGYPRNMQFPWRAWESDIWAHNTVIVDEGWPYPSHHYGITHTPHGRVEFMHDFRDPETGLGAQAVRIAVPVMSVYRRDGAPEISQYERTVVLMDVARDKFYVVDFFEVAGGKEHHLKWSFPQGVMAISGVALQARPGTVAGEHVRFATVYDSKRFGRKAVHNLSCLGKVRRGPARGPYRATWTAADDPAVHLRITQAHEPGTEAIFAEGRHPAKPDLYTLTFSLARRTGAAPLRSCYATVLEAYKGEPCVQGVERLDVAGAPDAVALRVTTDRGVDVIVVNAQNGARIPSESIDTDAALAVVRRTADGKVEGFLAGGTRLAAGGRRVTAQRPTVKARIRALDREAQEISVELPRRLDLTGRWIQVGNEDRQSTYRVTAQRTDAKGMTVLTLDRTSLLAEGVVKGVRDGLILNDVQIPLGGLMRGRVVSRMLSGATIECGICRYRVGNVEYGNYYRKRDNWNVHIDRRHQDATVRKLTLDFPTRAVFAIYDYAPGDTVTVVTEALMR